MADKKKNHHKKPKELLWESGEAFVAWLGNIGLWVLHTGKGIYKTLDALDSASYTMLWAGATKITDFAKRNMIKLFLAGSLLTYGGVKTISTAEATIENNSEISVAWNSAEDVAIFTDAYSKFHKKKITKSAPLTKYFLGLDQNNKNDVILSDTLIFNPAKNLHNLWTKKLEKYGKKEIVALDNIDVSTMSDMDIEDFRVKYPIDATYLLSVRPYIEWSVLKTTLSIDEFVSRTDDIAENTAKYITTYDGWLDQNKQNLLNTIKKELRWNSLVAYTMTELCENKEDGHLNKQLFDFILKNAGVDFLALVPAIYDNKTSYGLPQFTEYALYDTPKEKRWASVVNKYIQNPEHKLPGSVIDLHSREKQMQAAYMFAVYNYAMALSKLNDRQVADLERCYENNKEKFMNNITQLVAMCHHRPKDKSALKHWINDWFSRDIYHYGSIERTKSYGKATKSNYNALQ